MIPLVPQASAVPLMRSNVSLQPMGPTELNVDQTGQPAATATNVVQVTVRDSVGPGQHVAFTTPAGQEMSVPVTDHLPSGTVLTVQYPSPPEINVAHVQPQSLAVQQAVRAMPNQRHTAFADESGSTLAPPFPTISLNREDEQGMQIGWILYVLGWLSCCLAPFCFALALWTVVACMFHCKPLERRSHLPRQRMTARAAVWTLGTLATIACVVLVVFAMFFAINAEHQQHHGYHQHDQHDHHYWPHHGPGTDKIV